MRIDLHLHTGRYSKCSVIDPAKLVRQALRAGLDGIVITEHHRQWTDEELAELVLECPSPDFVALAGFEYTSAAGDILVYGLEPEAANTFLPPGHSPEAAVAKASELGGACIAAHPTRAGMGFDERIFSLPFCAIEIGSVNLKSNEQRLALNVSNTAKVPPISSSDAHQLKDVGAYWAEFDGHVRNRAELRDALKRGTFRPSNLAQPAK